MKKPSKSDFGVFIIENGVLIECIPPKRVKEIHLPRLVKVIGESAFINCNSTTSITLPDSVTEIGESAFKGCEALETVNIPNSVKRIGAYAFYGCKALKNITIPNSVTRIGECAFAFCESLNINISGSVMITPEKRNQDRKDWLMRKYPIGTRVKITELINVEPHLPSGSTGTVVGYDDQPALLMDWDNGSSLSLLPFEGDEFETM